MSTPYPGQGPEQPQQPHQPNYPGPTGDATQGGYGVPPYGSPAYGSPVPPPPPAYGMSPDRRPVTVTVAAWITIVLSSLSIIAGLVFAVGSDALVEYMRDNPVEAGLSPADLQDLDEMKLGLVVMGIGLVVCSAIAIVVAVFVLKRHNWARITLVVLAGITALLGLGGAFAALLGAPWLIGGIAVVVLLFVGGANEWFSHSAGSRGYGGYPPYPPGSQPPVQGPYQQGPYQQGPYQQGPYPPQ